MCRVMCRCVAVTLGLLLLFSCTTRKQLTAALHEEVRRAVETHLADTVWKHSVEQEREQTRWCVDVVREWVETADTLESRVADTPRVAEHWTIRAVSTRERQRVDSLYEERLLTNTDGRQQPVLGTGGSRRATTDRWRGIVDTLCDSGRAEHCLGGTGF